MGAKHSCSHQKLFPSGMPRRYDGRYGDNFLKHQSYYSGVMVEMSCLDCDKMFLHIFNEKDSRIKKI